jgi:hypothetical protein
VAILSDAEIERSELLKILAGEILAAFESIANAARIRLGQTPRGPRLEAFAVINQATAEKVVKALSEIQEGTELDCRKLLLEPAVARLVIADDDDNRETIYVSAAGTVDPIKVKLCSYMSAKGQLVPLSVGDFKNIKLPGGTKTFEVLEKVTFSPVEVLVGWDAKPAIVHSEQNGPTTVVSLRDLLAQAGVSEGDLDALDQLLAEADAKNNVFEGLQRSILTAMQLRVQPILDRFQDEIFRLPLDSRLVILGPPGTGKTTTLIKRLRQKIDFAFLDEDELRLVQPQSGTGIEHASSWLMFTPTELLKQFVKEAFNKEDVPAPEQRIRTWDDFRHSVARRDLPILRSGTSSGLIMRSELKTIRSETISNQIQWFEAFQAFQAELFIGGIANEAVRLEGADDSKLSAIGSQITAAVSRATGRPLLLLTEIAALLDELQRHIANLRQETRMALRRPLALHVRTDSSFLDALARHIATLVPDVDDELDDLEGDDDDEDVIPLQGRRAAEAAFIRALRARAISDATKRQPARGSRAGEILSWLDVRGVELPSLAEIGKKLLIQRAASRVTKAPSDFAQRIPARYRTFRRTKMAEGEWYNDGPVAANDVDPLEIDIILLAMMRCARQMSDDNVLMRRLGARAPAIIERILALQRNQILVDEATDFSPIQLACMGALASSRTDSFFACGDFNQRLTRWGSRSLAEFEWLFPDIVVKTVNVAYRQSRRLTEFAATLAMTDGIVAKSNLPEHIENDGVKPVFGANLGDISLLARWLSERIREIEVFTQQLPSIAVLVNDSGVLEPLANALSEALADMNIRALACPKGQAIGPENDVRIFEVEHIKGLEFEAVFFVDIDKLAQDEPDLFDKYIYVGATRAATYLGLTSSAPALPPELIGISHLVGENWKSAVE